MLSMGQKRGVRVALQGREPMVWWPCTHCCNCAYSTGGPSPRFCTRLPPPIRSGPKAPGAMRQRILGSHTPPCHRRMVITTQFSVVPCCTAAQTSSVPLQVAADCALALAICTLGSARTHHPPTVPVSLEGPWGGGGFREGRLGGGPGGAIWGSGGGGIGSRYLPLPSLMGES